MQYIKLMPANRFEGANRNRREIATALEAGYDVTVITLDQERPQNMDTRYKWLWSGIHCLNHRIPKMKRLWIILYDRGKLIHRMRKMEIDVISCHNLSALAIGYMAIWGKPRGKRPKLIYDSHEFELEKSGKRGRLAKALIKKCEKFLMERCAFSIMVNDSIADEVQRIHGLKQRPVVVRSTPEHWRLDEEKIAVRRRWFCETLGLPEEIFIVMYHGGVIRNRGIENMLRAVARVEGTAAVVLGNAMEEGYLEQLQALAKELGIEKQVLFHPAVEHERLGEYVGAVDVGTVMLMPVVKNHYYTLPNKFFENIQAMTPVIVSDFPEVGRLTREYGIGETVDPANVEQIAAAICELKENGQKYTEYKKNLARAKEELCWEREKVRLTDAFRNYL